MLLWKHFDDWAISPLSFLLCWREFVVFACFLLLLFFGGKNRVCVCCPVPSLAWSPHTHIICFVLASSGDLGLQAWGNECSLSAEALPFLLSVLGIEQRTCPCYAYTATGQLVHGFLFFLTHSFSTVGTSVHLVHQEVAPRLLSPWFLPHSDPHVRPSFIILRKIMVLSVEEWCVLCFENRVSLYGLELAIQCGVGWPRTHQYLPAPFCLPSARIPMVLRCNFLLAADQSQCLVFT